MKEQLQAVMEARVREYVGLESSEDQKIGRKLKSLEKRQAKLVKTEAKGRMIGTEWDGKHGNAYYMIHYKHLIDHLGYLYIEEEIEKRKASVYEGRVIKDSELPTPYVLENPLERVEEANYIERAPYHYDRMRAVQYAERWWNDYSPDFPKFEVDCTNYVSQCMYAGGAPMRGYPQRTQGWWYQNKQWSFSWSVANALSVYLQHSKTGLRAVRKQKPEELELGDVICYDFEGDGRYNHNTIVTGKDAAGMPLVNAHTYNSRMRYWAYEDSTAYTPNIQYQFFHIVDDT